MKKSLIIIIIILVLGVLLFTPQFSKLVGMKPAVLENMIPSNLITYDSENVTIIIDNLAFLPVAARIKSGTTVTWINKDKAEHTIALTHPKTNKVIESELLETGDSYSYTFTGDDIWNYICGVHPFMKGIVVVGNPTELSKIMTIAPDTPAPTVISITPNSVLETGKGKVIVKGKNFVEGTTVFFHHLFGDVKFIDSETLEVIVPEHYPLKMDIIVTNPDGDHYTLVNSFEFTAAKEIVTEVPKEPSEFTYKEERTIHFVSSTPSHGDLLDSSPSIVSVSFNFPIVKGSTLQVLDLKGNILSEGDLAENRLGLLAQPSKLSSGTYEVRYHAVWLGGSAHNGKFWFVVK